jgi:hypothetical protein
MKLGHEGHHVVGHHLFTLGGTAGGKLIVDGKLLAAPRCRSRIEAGKDDGISPELLSEESYAGSPAYAGALLAQGLASER